MEIIESKEFKNVIIQISERVYTAQYQALRAVNTELVQMYWDIGEIILETQKKHSWGDGVIETMSEELKSELGGRGDFSRSNLFRAKQFFQRYHSNPKVSQLVRLLPWGHISVVLTKIQDDLSAEYYIKLAIKSRWSRSTLESKINRKDYESWLLSQTNFKTELPSTILEQAEDYMRDDIDLSFLDLQVKHKELELEDKIVKNIDQFLRAMGGNFSYLGRQYEVEVGSSTYKIDLLFYHRALNCLFAIELKADEFKPEYAGKLSFYLTALDEKVKKTDENPSIGMILCRSKDREKVRTSLKFMTKPMGVTTYEKSELPEDIAKYLPSEEEISRKLLNLFNENENTDK